MSKGFNNIVHALLEVGAEFGQDVYKEMQQYITDNNIINENLNEDINMEKDFRTFKEIKITTKRSN